MTVTQVQETSSFITKGIARGFLKFVGFQLGRVFFLVEKGVGAARLCVHCIS